MYSYDSYDVAPNIFASIFGGAFSLVWLAILVLTVVAMWRLFEKAGKEGWRALVPFYNTYTLFEIAWGNGWLFLLMLVPCVNAVVLIILQIKLAKAFGKSGGFAVGLIFLNTIFMLILGLGSDQYCGPDGGSNGSF